MSFKLEMLTKKLQMLVTSCVSNEQKVKWFKQWNQLTFARGPTKFLKQRFLDAICAKWLQKVTFGFRWAPHYIQIDKSNLLLGTFGAKLRCVLIFFYFTWRSFVFQKLVQK
jgi:hypothetical protein